VEQLPWFQHALDADFEQTLAQIELAEGAALDLGCGPGTQTVALSKRGFTVTASDVSPSVVESARQLAQAEGVTIDFHVDDILDSRLTGVFDLLLDRGIFHCFDDTVSRQAYLQTTRRLEDR